VKNLTSQNIPIKLKPLLLLEITNPLIAGGYRREYETLVHGAKLGIKYVVVMDYQSYKNATKIFTDFHNCIRNHKIYITRRQENRFHSTQLISTYKQALLLAIQISKIAQKEDVSLILSQNESPMSILKCYLAGKMSSKPWTVILQGFPAAGNLNYSYIDKSIWSAFMHGPRIAPLKRKHFSLAELFISLKLLGKTVTLSASKSIPEELRLFNDTLKIIELDPPCGIDLKLINSIKPSKKAFDAFYYGRFIPSKGIFDLPLIWKQVVKRHPGALLGIAGPAINKEDITTFVKLVEKYSLKKNVVYFGPLSHEKVLQLLKKAKVLIYPSREDSFSMVVLESLASGVPVVGYNLHALKVHFGKVPGVRLFPTDSVGDLATEVSLLITNESFRKRLMGNSEAFVQKFIWSNVVSSEVTAYQYVIDQFNR
jgi:glycosyltransferase involved in cell wall biosynthesis